MNYLSEIFFGVLPFLLLFIPFWMNNNGFDEWVVRKSIHLIGNSVIVLYLAILAREIQIYLTLIIFMILLLIFSIIPRYDLLHRIIMMSKRDTETDTVLLINTIVSFAMIIIIYVIFEDRPEIFISGILSLAWGDGLGELIGKPFGKHKYKIFKSKSVEGSIAVFFGTYIAILTGFYFSYVNVYPHLLLITFIALIAMIVEAFSFSYYDNILVPVSVSLLIYFLL